MNAQQDDGLDIPAFLLRVGGAVQAPGKKSKRKTPPPAEPGADAPTPVSAAPQDSGFIEIEGDTYVLEPNGTIKIGKLELRPAWLRDAGTRAMVKEHVEEQERKAQANRERLAELKSIPKANKRAGQTRLSAVLETMGDKAPSYGAAKRAVEGNSLIHSKWWFDDIDLPRLKDVLAKLPAGGSTPSPFNKGPSRRALAEAALNRQHVIVLKTKTNPRREGTGKHARFQAIMDCNGNSVGAFLDAGGNGESLTNAVKEGLVEIREGTVSHSEQPASKKPAKGKTPAKKSKGKK